MYAYRVAISLSRIRLTVATLVAAGVLNLLLSIGFVRYFKLGLLGIAAGTLVSVTLWSNIFMGLFMCRSCGISAASYYRGAYARPGLTLFVLLTVDWGVAHLWIPGSLLQTMILLGFLAITFCPIVFALGLTADERASVRKWLSPRLSVATFRLRKVLAHASRNKLIELMIVGAGRRGGGPSA